MKAIVFFILLIHSGLFAQSFLNGSFEKNTISNSNTNISNARFNSKMSDVYAFGPYGNMDIIRSSSTLSAQDGNWYLGIMNYIYDLISMKLDSNLTKGEEYKISFYDLADVAGSPDTIEIGLSTSKNSFGDLIYKSVSRASFQTWTENNFKFIAPNSGRYITVRQQGIYNWVAIDNFTFVCPNVDLGNDTVLCTGQSLKLNAYNEGARYKWQNGSSDSVFTITQSGNYWVKVDAYNCAVYDNINVTYNSYPTVDLGKDTSLCDGDSLILNATSKGGTYEWNNNSLDSTISITESGLYWVNLTVAFCTSIDSVDVIFKPIPYIELGSDITVCENDSHLFLANNNDTLVYIWNTGSSDSSLKTNSPGKYWLNVSDGECTSSDTVSLFNKPFPHINLGNDTILCEGQSLNLNIGIENGFYKWSNGSESGIIEIKEAGLYWASITLDECVTIDSIQVDFKTNPNLNLGIDTSFCEGSEMNIILDEKGVSYQWMDGSYNTKYAITKSGYYSVTASKNDCVVSDTVKVSVHPYPLIELGNDTLICDDIPLRLEVKQEEVNVIWLNKFSEKSYKVSSPRVIWVEVEKNNCISRDTIAISSEDCNPSMILPNVFTPNGDGINDGWHAIYQNLVTNVELQVFDRSGTLVFESNDLNFNWVGIDKNHRLLPSGTYFFTVNYLESKIIKRHQKGIVNILK